MSGLDPLNLTDEQKEAFRRNNRKWKVPSGPPLITTFVRHSPGCKYAGDEFEKRCRCPKHLRWTHDRTQYRVSAHTRSWSEAESRKREMEDQLAGRVPEVKRRKHSGTSRRALTSSFRTRKSKASRRRDGQVHARAGPTRRVLRR